jgi:hypothetical protein
MAKRDRPCGCTTSPTKGNDVMLLIGPDGNLVKNKTGRAAFSYAEARRFLDGLLDRKKNENKPQG